MTLLLLLVPLSVVLLGVAIAAFAWAVRSGQFDDLDTPPLDVLREDTLPPPAARIDPAQPPPPARDDGSPPRDPAPRAD